MLDPAGSLPDDTSELRLVAGQLAATVKSQALEIAKLRHQLAGHRRHRFGSTSETMEQLELSLEEEEIAAAKIAPPAPPDTAAAPKNKPCLSGCHPHPLYVWCGVKWLGRRTKRGWMFCSPVPARNRWRCHRSHLRRVLPVSYTHLTLPTKRIV